MSKPTKAICIYPFTFEVIEKSGNIYRHSVPVGTIADLEEGKWLIWCGDISKEVKQYFRPLLEW